ncbi:hypothetical protein [Shewanella glacialipiscicola]|uniref:hypothetical protein n=1 Tax=Shewanella glacialipiscicola TaxID=614069 RepID=UPI003D7B5CE3
MDDEKLKQLRELIDQVANSSTKKNAAPSIRKLDFMVSNIVGHLNGYTAGKLREAVRYAKDAAGQVKNRDSLISTMENSWSVFEGDVRFGDSGKKPFNKGTSTQVDPE